MRAVTVSRHGGPEQYELIDAEVPTVGSEQVLVRVSVAGVNFLDVYQRAGLTPLGAPFVAGVEGVGEIVEVGSRVRTLTVGQRVGWLTGGQGSFAEYAAVDASKTVPLPDDVDERITAAMLMQGVTAHYLATDTFPVQAGDTVLIHAAAGGVGQLLTQVAKLRGATVIGTVSTAAKAATALAVGVDHAVLYGDFVRAVRELTNGEGVAAVYDGVGQATFEGSIQSLAVRGTYVIYGNASGPTPPLDIAQLNSGGSLYVTRPSVAHYTRTTEELRSRSADLFRWLSDGALTANISATYPLADVRKAFTALESRETRGKVLLVP